MSIHYFIFFIPKNSQQLIHKCLSKSQVSVKKLKNKKNVKEKSKKDKSALKTFTITLATLKWNVRTVEGFRKIEVFATFAVHFRKIFNVANAEK
jgi:hypothetical protein